MKTLIIFVLMTIPMFAMAEEEHCVTTTETTEERVDMNSKVPPNLKGAKIIVETPDGKRSVMTEEQFKVVPRKQQLVVKKIHQVDRIRCTPVVKRVYRKNRISLLGGQGPKTGLDTRSNGNTVEAESRVGLIGGIQYQRLLNSRVSVGGQLQTNKTVLVEVGLDF